MLVAIIRSTLRELPWVLLTRRQMPPLGSHPSRLLSVCQVAPWLARFALLVASGGIRPRPRGVGSSFSSCDGREPPGVILAVPLRAFAVVIGAKRSSSPRHFGRRGTC